MIAMETKEWLQRNNLHLLIKDVNSSVAEINLVYSSPAAFYPCVLYKDGDFMELTFSANFEEDVYNAIRKEIMSISADIDLVCRMPSGIRKISIPDLY